MLDDTKRLDEIERKLEEAVAAEAERLADLDAEPDPDLDGDPAPDTDLAESEASAAGMDESIYAGVEPSTAVEAPKKKKKKRKAKKPRIEGTSRGLETLFRTAYDTQLSLTALADSKANMLISVNGVIISIIIAAIVPQLEDNPLLLIPTGALLAGTISAIVFAILAAQPRVSKVSANAPITPERNRNLLFFGEFSQRSQEEYVAAMSELVADQANIYDAMLRNIYGLGAVLRRKFRLLSIAYTSFMLALVLGAISSIFVFTLS